MNQQYYPGAINASDCISNGWNMIKDNYWMFFGISVVALLILMAVGCIPFLSVILNPLLSGPIFFGVYYSLLRQMRGEPVEFSMLFRGFNSFLPAMVVSLTAAAPVIILQILNLFANFASMGMQMVAGRNGRDLGAPAAVAGGLLIVVAIIAIVMVIISIIVQISLVFALPLLADNEGMSPVDAMKLSARAAWSNIGGLILLFILEFLIMMAGTFALCIGILFVLPIIYAANAFAYRQVFPDTRQSFQNIPPPPTNYGENYGFGR